MAVQSDRQHTQTLSKIRKNKNVPNSYSQTGCTCSVNRCRVAICSGSACRTPTAAAAHGSWRRRRFHCTSYSYAIALFSKVFSGTTSTNQTSSLPHLCAAGRSGRKQGRKREPRVSQRGDCVCRRPNLQPCPGRYVYTAHNRVQ